MSAMQERRLSAECEECVESMFGAPERERVRQMLIEECGNNLPFSGDLDVGALDRCRFAVLKLSEGDGEKFRAAIALAKQDWRDLFVAAGFAHDTTAHRRWYLTLKARKVQSRDAQGT
ncbi:hypothetical protein [Occallatibacter savannae]|uniref:hypothetical protein n=1 Tax=Occallatibacter savannae TaxID=1002691 RepID=UPI0013A55786|nr:hypothetical protein [Occallatibacter savannae]